MNLRSKVRPKSPELQQKYGMLAEVSIDIVMDDGTIAATLDGILLSRSRNGNLYLSMPAKKYQSQGETRYFNYIKLFPKARDKANQLTKVIIEKARAAGVPVGDGQTFVPPSQPKPPAPQTNVPPSNPTPQPPQNDGLDNFFE